MNELNLTTVTLRRTESDDTLTLGEMRVTDRDIVCYTLELPDRGNQQDVSRIPCGTYRVEAWDSPSKRKVFKVLDVPGREDILIHIGNFPKDTKGCILVGLDQTSDGVWQSIAAMKKLQGLLKDEPWKLIITDEVVDKKD